MEYCLNQGIATDSLSAESFIALRANLRAKATRFATIMT